MEFTLDHRAELDSTNLEALRQARAGAAEGLVVIADSQSAGRGRHGRVWQSLPGNLLISILLRPEISPCRLGELAFVTAVAVADAVDRFAPGKVALKWPNDILLDGKKLGGILIENEIACDRVDWSVVGIGINIAYKPDDARYPAACLNDYGASCSRDDLVTQLLKDFAQRCDQWQAQGFASIRADWMNRAWNLGAPISINTDNTNLTGTFDGIDGSGALLLATERGHETIVSGTLSYEATA
jgi:BirA family biotin operon repressor/biotin-[acetyl-CoA-carboxylase] ligase